MRQTPAICFKAERASRSRKVFAPLSVESSASHVPERTFFESPMRADQAPRQPCGAWRADQVPPMRVLPRSSTIDQVPSATSGVVGAISAVQKPRKTRLAASVADHVPSSFAGATSARAGAASSARSASAAAVCLIA
jgi:hypothetical protein